MDDKQFALLTKKLDTIITLLSIDRTRIVDKTKTEAIIYLYDLGQIIQQ